MEEEKIEEGKVVEDARTGEIIPKGSPPVLQPGILAQININQVGTLRLEESEIASIEEPLDPKDVQIRPDGLVYLPWIWYNKRLNKAFGYLAWGLIPQGAPQTKNMGDSTLIVWLHWLVVRGVPISMAGGETSYRPSNYTMSYGDAVEGARSNSLARNCKNLGMALELWDHEWVENWKRENAETYKDDKGKVKWRKKGQKQSNPKPQNAQNQAPAPQNQEQATEVSETTSEPVSDASKAATEETYTGNQILGSKDGHLVKWLVDETKKTTVDVCKVVGALEKGHKFTMNQVKNMILGETK